MELAQQITNYYFEHFDELPEDKRFHFANRLAAWSGDERAVEALREMRGTILPNSGDLSELFKALAATPAPASLNSYAIRQPFFDKYQGLYGINLALFRLRHIQVIYGVDATSAFYKAIPCELLDGIAGRIVSDREAIKMLSTYAINYLYLYQLILNRQVKVDLDDIINLQHDYAPDDRRQLRLLIYLFTHCIIGETNFYERLVPAEKLTKYLEMLKILERVIDENYELISLDNKLEFLVCARICNFSSDLFDRVEAECRQSVSRQGCFLIDRRNKANTELRISIDKSEHRNVLYIMSQTAYQPHPILLK